MTAGDWGGSPGRYWCWVLPACKQILPKWEERGLPSELCSRLDGARATAPSAGSVACGSQEPSVTLASGL